MNDVMIDPTDDERNITHYHSHYSWVHGVPWILLTIGATAVLLAFAYFIVMNA